MNEFCYLIYRLSLIGAGVYLVINNHPWWAAFFVIAGIGIEINYKE